MLGRAPHRIIRYRALTTLPCNSDKLSYQIHPQRQRIASHSSRFCKIALYKGHNLIHMTAS